RAHPELQDAVRSERDGVDRSALQLVVAWHLGPDLRQVRLRIPVELSAHRVSLPSERVYADGGIVDLERLALSHGQARTLELEVGLDPLELGGQSYSPAGGGSEARLDISRTSTGYALRLRFSSEVTGPCVRCLADATSSLEIDSREVDQGGTTDDELRSPYVSEGNLDVDRWANDALLLAFPSQPLCRADCARLCAVRGQSLNHPDPQANRHGSGGDPRMAKLRDLRLD